MSDSFPVGICTSSHYYEDSKSIKFFLRFDNGREYGFEWPITMFRFAPEMDRDEEMRKTAKLMHGKKFSVKSEEK